MEINHCLEITPEIYWTGVLDPHLKTFDVVMETKFGTTYNSYFIQAEKKTLIDTVKKPFWPVYLEKLKSITDPADIEYIIVNHTEPDHSGCLPFLLEIATHATVVGSGNAIRYLQDQMGRAFKHQIVKDGDTLDLGNKTLRFIAAPNLHWPDTIYTYLEQDQILFTCDSFGCHYCHEKMFDDAVGDFDEAFEYYFNVILKPYSKFLLKAIQKIRPLEIKAIAPGHGPILANYWKKFVDWSETLSREACQYPDPKKALIAFVSAYRNTALMAEKIAEGIRSVSPELLPVLCDMEKETIGVVEQKVIESGTIIVGSPLINQNILLHIYQLFGVMNPIRDRGKLGGAFGSYGWSGDFLKIMESNLSSLKLNVVGEGVYIRFSPHKDELDQCVNYGRLIGQKMLEENAKCSEK